MFLLHHPEIQDNLYSEIESIGEINLTNYPQFHLTRAVMHESMRLSAVVPCGVPHCVAEDVKVGPYFFPKGATVFANLAFILRDPRVWDHSDVFDPGRFLDQDGCFQNK